MIHGETDNKESADTYSKLNKAFKTSQQIEAKALPYRTIPVKKEKIPDELIELATFLNELTGEEIILIGSTGPNIDLGKPHPKWDLCLFDYLLYKLYNQLLNRSEIKDLEINADDTLSSISFTINGHKQSVSITVLKKSESETIDDAMIRIFNERGEINLSSLYMFLNRKNFELRGSPECVLSYLAGLITVMNLREQIFLKNPARLIQLVIKKKDYGSDGFDFDPKLHTFLKKVTPKECFISGHKDPLQQIETAGNLQKLFTRFDDPTDAIIAMHELENCFEGLTNIPFDNIEKSDFDVLSLFKECNAYTKRLVFCIFALTYFGIQQAYLADYRMRMKALDHWQLVGVVEEVEPDDWVYLNYTVNQIFREHLDTTDVLNYIPKSIDRNKMFSSTQSNPLHETTTQSELNDIRVLTQNSPSI